MTWDRAKSASFPAVLGFSRRVFARIAALIGWHGPAPITGKRSKRNGPNTSQRTSLIEMRAIRKAGNNRPEVIRAYKQVHMTLSRER